MLLSPILVPHSNFSPVGCNESETVAASYRASSPHHSRGRWEEYRKHMDPVDSSQACPENIPVLLLPALENQGPWDILL